LQGRVRTSETNCEHAARRHAAALQTHNENPYAYGLGSSSIGVTTKLSRAGLVPRSLLLALSLSVGLERLCWAASWKMVG
jgi:hypothetical protein